ncbi:chromate transporter [Pseudoxanthobacter sp.]|uniref:chromate transporter n=1 Tax=Pseudoxanthobacter sp. TaxID=1925742 RepID=UPI002FE23FBD
MSDSPPPPAAAAPPPGTPTPAAVRAGLWEIFVTFLIIGATSFGGGVVAYLRNSLVLNKKWLDEDGFMVALSISQALPGLNATNMAIIVGDRLRGVAGAVAGFLGMTLPGGLFILVLGVAYASSHNNPWITAALAGVGAASVGLLAAITLQIGRKQLVHLLDLSIVIVTVVMVSFLHISLVWVLLTVGPVAIFLFRPRNEPVPGPHDHPVD